MGKDKKEKKEKKRKRESEGGALPEPESKAAKPEKAEVTYEDRYEPLRRNG